MKYDNLIQCSMGRDSLALVEFLRSEWDRSLVVWVDAGGTLPEVQAIAEMVEKEVPHFLRIETSSAKWIRENGYPSDLVPVWQSGHGKVLAENTGPEISSCLSCCRDNIMMPMHAAAFAYGVKRIYRGQRNVETLKSPIQSGYSAEGIEIVFPLQDWTDEQVEQFLRETGWPVSKWYAYGKKGMDCWWCTGFRAESKGLHRYLAEAHPEKMAVVDERFIAIEDAVMRELNSWKG